MATTSNPNVITLNCLIPGDYAWDIITLEVPKEAKVNVLRPMIRKWWPVRFKGIDPNRIELYQKILLPDLLNSNDTIGENFSEEGIRMDPLLKISDYFKEDNRYKLVDDSDYEKEENPGYKHDYKHNGRCVHILIELIDPSYGKDQEEIIISCSIHSSYTIQ